MGGRHQRSAYAVMVLGVLLVAVAVLWAVSGPAGDANIGAGLIGLAGAALVCFGVAGLALGGLLSAIRRLRQ